VVRQLIGLQLQKYYQILNFMKSGGCVLLDGATGTELERRGVPQIANAWNGGGALSHPDILKNIHKSYIKSGAQIIISNTFATCKHTLKDADQLHNFEKLNSAGVRLAKESREEISGKNILVAGGISYWSFTGNHPPLEHLRSNIAQQSHILASSGADLLMLEMMVDIDRMLVTLEAAQQTKLPVWVGVSCIPDPTGRMCLENGDPLDEAVYQLLDKNVDVINIMHTDVKFVDEALEILKTNWPGLIGVYAHSGKMINNNWTFKNIISHESYASHVERWMDKGISLVGGCCGITTEHIQHIADHLFGQSD
jgi:S-methylmethionine-dependent homocysteine/selenocysteine methylase